LELFRRITTEYRKGESRYYDPAQEHIAQITHPQIGVYASNIFLPESEIQLNLSWRNIDHIDLKLYKFNFEGDLFFDDKDQSTYNWIHQINLKEFAPVASWIKEVKDDGKHQPVQELWRMDRRLQPGSYIMEAHAGGVTARDLVLVTGATLVL